MRFTRHFRCVIFNVDYRIKFFYFTCEYVIALWEYEIISKPNRVKMLNLLHSSVCGSSDNVNTANANDSHFLSENLQQNGNLKSKHFDEKMKIEHIASVDKIAYIKIRDDVISAPPPIKPEVNCRTKFQKFFLQKYPDFFRHYCLCMHRKIEPNDLNNVSSLADDKYGANSFLFNRTPIIPITDDPKTYVHFVADLFIIAVFLII